MAPPAPGDDGRRTGYASKGGTNLARIIAIISTVRPLPDLPPDASADGRAASEPKVRLDIDLNLRLGPPPPEEETGTSPAESANVSTVEKGAETVAGEQSSVSPAESAVQEASAAGKSSEGECDPKNETFPLKEEEDDDAYKEAREERKKRGGEHEGYMGLLLEAVRQVSGGFSDDEGEKEAEPSRRAASAEKRKSVERAAQPKRRRLWWEKPTFGLYAAAAAAGYEEEAAPLVRSKRGRSQALPSRFRDSVLEPWAKPPSCLGPRSARHRTSR